MKCRYRLLFLFLCGFAELTVSTPTCGREILVGTSCRLKMTFTSSETPIEMNWVHESSGDLIHWKKGKIRTNSLKASLEVDGTLTFNSVSMKNSGTYTYTAFDSIGNQNAKGTVIITVYENVPKPTVKVDCESNGKANLTCMTGDSKDLEITWNKDNSVMQNEKKQQLFLTSSQVKEYKPYSCRASNPVSNQSSDSVTISCPGLGFGLLFGFDFWIVVSICVAGGALLLLMICVLTICACRSCRQRKLQLDEAEMRLQTFHDSENGGTQRSKHTARGQPAPPIPQEEPINGSPSPQTTPRLAAPPKAQSRARPPPPPQDEDGEDPPPLPRPRNKQRKQRTQEPYRPME